MYVRPARKENLYFRGNILLFSLANFKLLKSCRRFHLSRIHDFGQVRLLMSESWQENLLCRFYEFCQSVTLIFPLLPN